MASRLAPTAIFEGPERAGGRRLLLLSTDLGMGGGAEEQVIRLAYAFRKKGWETLIVSLLPPSPMPPGFEDRGIPVAHLGMRRGQPDPRSVLRFSRLVREFRPDVVHSHMVHANLLARAARLIQPFPVLVCTLHNLTMAGVEKDWTSAFELAHRVTDGFAELTTAISQSAAGYYVRRRAVPGPKMIVMPNGIDTNDFRHDPSARRRLRRELGVEGRFVWLAVGRLEKAKAYPTLLRAFARLGDGPRTLLVCGQGSLRDEMAGLAEELGVAGRVQFLGLRTDVPALLSAADAFALSSDMEGLPLVLLQATAAGLPVVATDVGGNPEVIAPGVNGDLVPPGDPEAFAREMARVEALPAEGRAALGRAGRDRTERRFEAEQVMDRWEGLFEARLGEGPRRPRRFAERGRAARARTTEPPRADFRGRSCNLMHRPT